MSTCGNEWCDDEYCDGTPPPSDPEPTDMDRLRDRVFELEASIRNATFDRKAISESWERHRKGVFDQLVSMETTLNEFKMELHKQSQINEDLRQRLRTLEAAALDSKRSAQ